MSIHDHEDPYSIFKSCNKLRMYIHFIETFVATRRLFLFRCLRNWQITYISVNLICIFSESIINGMKIIVKSDDIVDVLENSFAQEIGAFYCSCHFRMLNATCNDTKVLRQCWKRVFHTEKKFQWKNSGALKNESWKKSNFIFCIISKFSIKMEVTL